MTGDERDRRFLEALRTGYAPPPESAEERVDFTRRLDARIARRHRWGRLVPGAIGVAASAALVWALLPAPPEPEPAPRPSASVPEAWQADWQGYLLYPDELEEAGASDTPQAFPDEYLAIASAFLDG